MAEIHSRIGPLPSIPDDLTIPQFLLDDYQHPLKPRHIPGVPWLIEQDNGRKIGLEEICSRTFGLANAVHSRWNFAEEDVGCIFSPNHVDYFVVVWGIHRLGGVVTTANPAFSAEELTYQLTKTKSRLIFTIPESLDVVTAAARASGIPTENIILFDPAPASSYFTLSQLIAEGHSKSPSFVEKRLKSGESKTKLALLLFSSGTTGLPKAVATSHYNVIANILQAAAHHLTEKEEDRRFRPGDVVSGVLPYYHAFALVLNVQFCLFNGMSVVVTPKFNFLEFLRDIERFRITHFMLVPPQMVLMCKDDAVLKCDLRHVRFCAVGAAPVSDEMTREFIRRLPNCSIGQGYGLTETTCLISFVPPTQRIGTPRSAGQLIPGLVVRVERPDGTLAKFGEPGELVAKGPGMAMGYFRDEKATKAMFNDGWVHTGDEVCVDENGEVYVLDRIKELIKVRGFQVPPAELEGHLLDHPDIADACVVSVLDDYNGENPVAVVVLTNGTLERIKNDPREIPRLKADIEKHVADHKAYYKRLTGGVKFADSIPKTPSGKILRRVLRTRIREERAGQAKAKL